MVLASIYFVSSLVSVVTSDSLTSPLHLDLPVESITSPYPNGATISSADADVDVKAGLASRLRWMLAISLVFASVSLARPVVSFIIHDTAGFDGLEATWSFAPLGVALLLAAILEVWRHGVNPQIEQDLTV